MIFEQIPTGGDRNFAYLVGDGESGEGALVDPSNDPRKCIKAAEAKRLVIRYIINTHGHSDHTNGNDTVAKRTGARIVAHQSAWQNHDVDVHDGDRLKLGNLRLEFIHTPGHTDDAVCVLAEDKLMTGDTLFVGKVGGTDLGEGARTEFESLHRLMKLPDNVEVYPGHDYGTAPSSTIGHEKKTNPFLLQKNFEDFVYLKEHWAAYKKQHGIQ
jgi:glyoxylase-like metal-dependent hydrolase (beta-lactamase superfamily II)